jgi:hypothetical protein
MPTGIELDDKPEGRLLDIGKRQWVKSRTTKRNFSHEAIRSDAVNAARIKIAIALNHAARYAIFHSNS